MWLTKIVTIKLSTLCVYFCWFSVQERKESYRNYSLECIATNWRWYLGHMLENWRFGSQLPVHQQCGHLQQRAAVTHLALKLGEPRQDWKWHLRTEERKAEVEIKGEEWVWWHIFQVLVLQCGAFSVGESKPTGLTLKGALTHLKYIHNNPPAWRFLITSPCLLSQALPALTYHISLHFTWYAIPCPKLCLLLLFWHLTTMSQSWLQVCCPKSRIGHPVHIAFAISSWILLYFWPCWHCEKIARCTVLWGSKH